MQIERLCASLLVVLSVACSSGGESSPGSGVPTSANEGSSTDWHLEEHSVVFAGATEASFVADCRGNNSLSWQVRMAPGQAFPEPARVKVYCGMYADRPANDSTFQGWGWTRTNWPGTGEACSFENRTAHGEEQCGDYFRAQRETVPITAPWCQVSFVYPEATTFQAQVISYCVTR